MFMQLPHMLGRNVHTWMFTHECSHMNVHTWMFTHECSHTNVHTPMFTHQCSHMNVHTWMFTHECSHMNVHTWMFRTWMVRTWMVRIWMVRTWMFTHECSHMNVHTWFHCCICRNWSGWTCQCRRQELYISPPHCLPWSESHSASRWDQVYDSLCSVNWLVSRLDQLSPKQNYQQLCDFTIYWQYKPSGLFVMLTDIY